MNELKYVLKTAASLKNMIIEMNEKRIELKRITKTAAMLLLSGNSVNSIPLEVVERCLDEQTQDGGWVSILDTMWNVFFLKQINEEKYRLNLIWGWNVCDVNVMKRVYGEVIQRYQQNTSDWYYFVIYYRTCWTENLKL